MELLLYMVILCLVFWRNLHMVFHNACTNLVPFYFCFCFHFHFCFGFHCLRRQVSSQKNILYNICQRVFCRVLFQGFMVSCLTFIPLIHFEFIPLPGVRKCSFLCYMQLLLFSQSNLLRLSFLHCVSLLSFLHINWP